MPGKYTVVLTVGGKSYTQSLQLQMDPRVKASTADLAEQFRLSKQVYDEWLTLGSISESLRTVRGQLTEIRPRASEDLKKHVDELSEKLQTLAGGGGGAGPPAAGARPTIATITGRLRTLFSLFESVDAAPTPQAAAAVPVVLGESRTIQGSWQLIRTQDIPALNQELRAAGLPELTIPQ